ncbi:MAG TPA: TlpA disulfide reductase family protein [Solirubrobacterales bacterium]|nr:TlpA disulfide reductase family protein [Solirubrobacterales bacterium]
MSKRLQALALVAAVPLVVAVTVVLAGSGEEGDPGAANPESQAPDYERAFSSAPAPIAALYEQANELLSGGLDAFDSELRRLDGYPVVANLWASWCGPCRSEFPYFQRQSAERADSVAFIGVDSRDSDDAARTFLEQLPVPYPSISDPDGEVWTDLGAVGLPATAFYDAGGELVHLKQGEYRSEDELAADIERYAR